MPVLHLVCRRCMSLKILENYILRTIKFNRFLVFEVLTEKPPSFRRNLENIHIKGSLYAQFIHHSHTPQVLKHFLDRVFIILLINQRVQHPRDDLELSRLVPKITKALLFALPQLDPNLSVLAGRSEIFQNILILTDPEIFDLFFIKK
jgi:hypothetical protein